MTPLFAESFATNINWTLIFTAAMAVATVLMWLDSKKARATEITPQPLSVQGTPIGNAEIARDLKSMNHRLTSLENWRSELITKMDDDKTEILNAGEHRAEKLHDRINSVLSAVSELKGTVDQMRRES